MARTVRKAVVHGRRGSKNLRRGQKRVTVTPATQIHRVLSPRALLDMLIKLDASLMNVADVGAWVREHGLDDSAVLHKLQETCVAMGNLLPRSPGSPMMTTTPAQGSSPWTPVTSQGAGDSPVQWPTSTSTSTTTLDRYYFYRRNTTSFALLTPVQQFEHSAYSLPKKVSGFVCEGDSPPIIYAIAGYENTFEHNAMMIDSEFWTKQVYRFGKRHCYTFRTQYHDQCHGVPDGYSYASHVECKIMLWYACKRVPGDYPTIHMRARRLHEVRRLDETPKIKIYLSRNACSCCVGFCDLISEITGIEYELVVLQTLGALKFARDPWGQLFMQRCADVEDDDEDQGDDEDDEEESEEDRPAGFGSPSIGRLSRIALRPRARRAWNADSDIEMDTPSVREMDTPSVRKLDVVIRQRAHVATHSTEDRALSEASSVSSSAASARGTRSTELAGSSSRTEAFHLVKRRRMASYPDSDGEGILARTSPAQMDTYGQETKATLETSRRPQSPVIRDTTGLISATPKIRTSNDHVENGSHARNHRTMSNGNVNDDQDARDDLEMPTSISTSDPPTTSSSASTSVPTSSSTAPAEPSMVNVQVYDFRASLKKYTWVEAGPSRALLSPSP